jgi:hypothetical protein
VLTLLLAKENRDSLPPQLRAFAAQKYTCKVEDIPYLFFRKVPNQTGICGVRAVNTVYISQSSAICFALAATLLLRTELQLPMLSQTPLRDWMDVPPVYRNTINTFSDYHIAKMTAPEFMNGIWEGYESREDGWGYTEIRINSNDSIHVVARRPTDSDYVEGTYSLTGITIIIDGSTSGADQLGSFTMHGL